MSVGVLLCCCLFYGTGLKYLQSLFIERIIHDNLDGYEVGIGDSSRPDQVLVEDESRHAVFFQNTLADVG